jgi:hypothetical protein
MKALASGLAALFLTLGVVSAGSPALAQPGQAPQLSDGDRDGILFMREEEKLARDVYLILQETWGLRIFENISAAEQVHMDTTLLALDRHGLDDPVSGYAIGHFQNQELQALYDQLIARGVLSSTEALRVGAFIEEIDIVDLDQRLATVQAADIRLVYESLRAGSENHLLAFVSTLANAGETYAPQLLSAEQLEAALANAEQRARRNRGVPGGS